MAISFPLSFPGTIKPRSATLYFDTNVSLNESPFTYESQVQVWEGQRWLIDIAFPDLTPDQMADWKAFLVALNGSEGTFLFGDPLAPHPRGNALGTPVVHGSGQQGNVLVTRGWAPNTTQVLKAGDYLQLGGNLHIVRNPQGHNSDGDGIASLDIAPRLRSPTVDGTALTLVEPKGTWRLADNRVGWGMDSRLAYNFGISAVEAL